MRLVSTGFSGFRATIVTVVVSTPPQWPPSAPRVNRMQTAADGHGTPTIRVNRWSGDVDSPTSGTAGETVGETDLALMLNTLTVSRRDGVRHVVNLTAEQWSKCVDDGGVLSGVDAVITEPGEEAVTVVCTGDALVSRGWRSAFAAVWLTLDVHSSLVAVGFTAAVSNALARAGIPANMIAGFHHDHILVPEDRAEEAVSCLQRLSRESRVSRPGRAG